MVMPENHPVVFRVPIYNQCLDAVYYELLHRTQALDDDSTVVTPELAASEVLVNTLIDIGLQRLVGQCRAFVHLTREHLVGEWLLPMDMTRFAVIVKEEGPSLDPGLLDALHTLREKGLVVVVDDFIYEHRSDPRLSIADIIRIDVQRLNENELHEQCNLLEHIQAPLWANNVSTQEVFTLCRRLGFDYFQGPFIAQPEMFTEQADLRANQTTTLQLLSEVQDPDISLERLESILANDVALSYKLMRFINSAYFDLHTPVSTLRQALVYMGLNALRGWVSLMIVLDTDDRPNALKELAVIRAKFCQLLAEYMGVNDGAAYFTAGLFSVLDTLLGMSMDRILFRIPIGGETKEALLNRTGPVGEVLRFAIAHERGLLGAGKYLHLNASDINKAYLEALDWSRELRLIDLVAHRD